MKAKSTPVPPVKEFYEKSIRYDIFSSAAHIRHLTNVRPASAMGLENSVADHPGNMEINGQGSIARLGAGVRQ
jgi:hypothetical protein